MVLGGQSLPQVYRKSAEQDHEEEQESSQTAPQLVASRPVSSDHGQVQARDSVKRWNFYERSCRGASVNEGGDG